VYQNEYQYRYRTSSPVAAGGVKLDSEEEGEPPGTKYTSGKSDTSPILEK